MQRRKLTSTTLPSPLLIRSPGLGFLDRTLSSCLGVGDGFCGTSVLLDVFSFATLSTLTSIISGAASGFVNVVSVRGNRWRLALGCCEMLSDERGRWRRRLRVAVAGPPSRADGENIVDDDFFD